MADATYQPKVYHKQGGDVVVVASGGEIQVEPGGAMEVPEVAASNTQGGITVLFRVLADQAGGADKDVVMDHKVRVIDAWTVNAAAGGAGDTITVKNGATAITDAMDTNKADKAVTRAATIDDAQHEIAAGGTLRVSKANGANDPNCDVYVLAIRVA